MVVSYSMQVYCFYIVINQPKWMDAVYWNELHKAQKSISLKAFPVQPTTKKQKTAYKTINNNRCFFTSD